MVKKMSAEERKELKETKMKLFDKVVALSNGFVSLNKQGLRISYSTGKYTETMEITWDFLLQARGSSIEQATSFLDARAHYELTKKIMEEKFEESSPARVTRQGHILMSDAACPRTVSFLVMHPEDVLLLEQNELQN